jgi:hypothetical protein
MRSLYNARMISTRSVRTLLLGPTLAALAVYGAWAYPAILQRGLSISKSGVQPGYVVFSAPDGNSYAIDVAGKVVGKWSSPEANTGTDYTRPLANGDLLARIKTRGKRTAPAVGDAVVEFTQDGREVWRYAPTDRHIHHDQERMENGNTLVVCSRELDRPAISKRLLTDDCLVEVDPSGKVVWDWQTADHYDELELSSEAKAEIMKGYPARAGAPSPAGGMDYLHMNAASPIPASAGHTDPRFRAGNIIVSYRFINTIAVVDHASKKIVWKMAGATIGQHNPNFIPADMPGTGHILVFDNGNIDADTNPMRSGSRPNSRVLEINPLDNSIVWEYTADKSNLPIWSFFSHYISSAQRLPNGNTLICEGANGRFFEVKPDGEIVWEFVNPFGNMTPKVPDYTVFRVAKAPETWLKNGSR